ncbi:MAG: 16S rRNA (guanine(527)-N(7))-methyltransferase RsmG [Aquificota bacterium]|nr:MAG: 16S rRNA (guanine(527)-N(7))-methyltransferase RsmG [Aquificota bacterium]
MPFKELVSRVFLRNKIVLSDQQAELFSIYLEELKRWNRVHNLTSIEEDEEIVIRHFLDSVSLKLCMEEKGLRVEGLSLCDVGSGAGFPGVPLKIYYQDRIKLTLIERVAKKCSFLEYLKVRLGIEYRVLCKDAGSVEETFDVVVCRALGKLEEILPILQRLSKGYVMVMKGKEVPQGYDHCRISLRDIRESYILFLAKSR